MADNGDIWVTDGHGGPQRGPNKDNMYGSRGGNNRLVRFSKDGTFIKAFGGGIGSEGSLPLQFNDPHDLQRDAEGRLYVADRGNQRVQVLDKEGNFITRTTTGIYPEVLGSGKVGYLDSEYIETGALIPARITLKFIGEVQEANDG